MAAWASNGLSPTVVGLSNVITLPVAGQNTFYRLKRE
jgi:hypothetical protein